MQIKPLLELLRRADKSKYKTVLLMNRMLIQCYDASQDSDMGMHYILHIPDTEDYIDEFYDNQILITIKEVTEAYKLGHAEVLEKKKKTKAKPKEVNEFVDVLVDDLYIILKMQFIVLDELVSTQVVKCKRLTERDNAVQIVTNTMDTMLGRSKRGGLAVTLDGYKSGCYYKLMNHAQIAYHKIKIGGVKVRIPLFKSMLAGIKEPDDFTLSIQETNIQDVYLYTIQLKKKEILEEYICYILNF